MFATLLEKSRYLLLLCSLLALNATEQPLPSPYLGQPLPSSSPTLFAPNLVSTGLVDREVSFSPDGKSCYWFVITGSYTTILYSLRTETGWSSPEVAPFSGQYADFEPCFSADGSRLYFVSDRPHPKQPHEGSHTDIWMMTREGATWSQPQPLGTAVNTSAIEYFPSLTQSGSLYFSRFDPTSGVGAVFRALFREGVFQTAEKLPSFTAEPGANVCVAPDESYLLYPGKRQTEQGDADFFISYRQTDGSWGKALPLNLPFRTWHFAEAARITPNGQYLFLSYAASQTSRGLWGRPQTLGNKRVSHRDLMTYHNAPGNSQLDVYWLTVEKLPKQ